MYFVYRSVDCLFYIWNGKNTLTQQLSCPSQHDPAISKWSVWPFLLIVSSLLVVFIGMVISYLPQTIQLMKSGHSGVSLLQGSGRGPLPRSVIYERADQLWIVSSWGGIPQKLSTPGYIYSPAVSPLLTPSGQLLYSGDGVWLTNPFSGHPRRIASLPTGQVITSLALSQDGSQLAWSSVPAYGKGTINLYAGSLKATVLVHQQLANLCPCFRVFSFLRDSASLGDKTLLLTEDHGDHGPVQNGLWIFNLNDGAAAQPRQLLGSDPPQGPLAVAPDDRHLLYTNWEGYTPLPEDSSLSDGGEMLSYANDLKITAINTQVPGWASSQVIVPGQLLPESGAVETFAYHWVMTPRFSPDGRTLVYLEFTGNLYAPFIRNTKIYTVNIDSSGTEVALGSPRLLATGESGYSELGDWLDEHQLTLYANGGIYALDSQYRILKKIVQTNEYVQIVATVRRGQV